MYRVLALAACLLFSKIAPAQAPAAGPILVADQTFNVSGEHEFVFALAAGDVVNLHFEMIAGRKMKAVEFLQFPQTVILSAYDADSVFDKSVQIGQTGIYKLRFRETGLGKKVCRFALRRSPGSAETTRLDTRVAWDLTQNPQFVVKKRPVATGKKLEVLSLGGKVSVPAFKLGLANPYGSYQFALPPNTLRWAYRISVGQATAEARRRDAEKLTNSIKSASVKLLGFEPESALAAFALGLAIDLGTEKSGENADYWLADEANAQNFRSKKPYQAFVEQKSVSVDAQRRYAPLEGSLVFLLRNDNWVDDIDVTVEIEAVTETTVFEEETFLEPMRP